MIKDEKNMMKRSMRGNKTRGRHDRKMKVKEGEEKKKRKEKGG